ncbi:hypothetical protein GCM10027277_10770 [Pseudoduganella ginsengisoli]|uniref:Bacterial Pleckstrin homology domain-containing protein n=1 Tax=Pseudoduganella ginsengisoli TaxID=1462440 RepID=A0A6L6PVA0_9BURK|nr:hypothetical protein [Pseudoduganella ginsengisoli]MTW01473.1 hypothetical protein [Pseudoduganella ginsengisoli]
MTKLPTSRRQLAYMALVLFAPVVLTVALVCWAPPKPGQTQADMWIAVGVVALLVVMMTAILSLSALRHAIDITPDTLVVKHSMYTLKLERAAVTSATVRELPSMDAARLSTKKNGTALFGYYSGWFWDTRSNLTFCAVSGQPVYLVAFEGSAKCRQLVLNASPEVAQRIAAWANPPTAN